MRKLFLSLFAAAFASTFAVAADSPSSTPPPVAQGDMPSGYRC